VATSRSGLLRFLVGFEPAVSTDTEDFDAELELLEVQGLPPGLGAWPECPQCGLKGVQGVRDAPGLAGPWLGHQGAWGAGLLGFGSVAVPCSGEL